MYGIFALLVAVTHQLLSVTVDGNNTVLLPQLILISWDTFKQKIIFGNKTKTYFGLVVNFCSLVSGWASP